MRVADLDYELPPELIAQRPLPERDGARLLIVDDRELEDRRVADLPDLLPEGALVVVNDTRVVPARLLGQKRGTGGRVEIFLLRRCAAGEGASQRFEAMGRSSKPLRPNAIVDVGALEVAIIEATTERDRSLVVSLTTRDGSSVDAAIEREGHVPLPPYVERADDADDRTRYQTIFADAPGAVAAPTAGLHFSAALVERLRLRNVEIAAVTLHVGLGTFQPVTALDLDEHRMHAETFSVGEPVVDAVRRARARGAPVVAIGTTAVRALESARDPAAAGLVRATSGETRLLIQPGYEWGVVDGLFTNFHLPKSTLLALVSAFGGAARVRAAYAHAVRERYRFFSYGDAMLIRAHGR